MLGRTIDREIRRWTRVTGLTSEGPEPTDAEMVAAHAHADARTAAMIPGVCAVGTVLMLVWIGVDAVLPMQDAAAAAYGRLRVAVLAALALGGAGAFVFRTAIARVGRAYLAALGVIVMALIGWSFAPLDPGQPYIHTNVWLAYTSLLVVVPFRPRVAVALGFSGGLWGGYVVTRPEYLSHPDHGLFLSTLVGQTVLALIFGHLLTLVLQDLYVTRARLGVLKQSLEDRVAAATHDLRALTRRIDSVREDERRWMAHAVHDELGQELTAMRFTLAMAQDQVRGGNPDSPATLDDLEQLLDRTNATMRRIIQRLRPVALDELGCHGALRWLARDVAKRTGWAVEVTYALDEDPADPLAEMLFRAAQEGLNNAARHAREATRVEVSVTIEGGDVVLEIDDDGAGMVGQKGPGSIGMIGIRERAAALGGGATWQAAPMGGVRLVVRAPLEGQA